MHFLYFLNNERAFSSSPYTYQSPAHLKPLARWSMKPFTSSGGELRNSPTSWGNSPLSSPLNVCWLAYSNHIALEKPPEGGSSKIADYFFKNGNGSFFSHVLA